MLLAIDTATRNSSVALYDENGVQAEINWRSRENHTVELMPQILHVLALAHSGKKDLIAVGVALGPGSFTGLRVGMSVAKGLAFSQHIPILGIPTLETIASTQLFYDQTTYAILTAGRGRYSIAPFVIRERRAERIGDYALVDANGLIERVRATTELRNLFCGEIDAALAQKIAQELGDRVLIAPPALNARRAGILAELAWARYQRGEADDVETLAPLYSPHGSA
jgi:tRNA threonylcarbamoyladenosine biosynthesis protein TsaB